MVFENLKLTFNLLTD